MPWEKEEIPNDANLYYRVPRAWLRPDLTLHPGIFQEKQGSMSTDWEKYSTASETKARQGRPERFGIVGLVAGLIREIPELSVDHEPIEDIDNPGKTNRAHSSVHGIESGVDLAYKERMRTELFKRFNTWHMHPDLPID